MRRLRMKDRTSRLSDGSRLLHSQQAEDVGLNHREMGPSNRRANQESDPAHGARAARSPISNPVLGGRDKASCCGAITFIRPLARTGKDWAGRR